MLRLINRLFPLWVILGAVTAYFHPWIFLGFLSEQVTLFFGITMFGIGVTLELGQAAQTLRRPDKIILGTVAQFTIMPFSSYFLAELFHLRPDLALGLIITGCVPGAMSSNVLSYLARGDVPYSIALTTLSTLVSPWVTPALTLFLIGNRVDVQYVAMMMTIINSVILPLAAGMAVRKLFQRRIKPFLEIFPTISIAAIVVICSVVVARNVDLIREASLSIFYLVVLLNVAGMLGGYVFGILIRLSEAGKRTLAIEIGMQNAGMGVILALTHFKDQAGAALPSAIFATWCIVSASLFTLTPYRSKNEKTAQQSGG